jgi:hypothetical protein
MGNSKSKRDNENKIATNNSILNDNIVVHSRIKVFTGQIVNNELICKSFRKNHKTGNANISATSFEPLLTHEDDSFFKKEDKGVCIVLGVENDIRYQVVQRHVPWFCTETTGIGMFENLSFQAPYYLDDYRLHGYKFKTEKKKLIKLFGDPITCLEKKQVFLQLDQILGSDVSTIIAKYTLNAEGMMDDRNNICICDDDICGRYILPHLTAASKLKRQIDYVEKFHQLHEQKLLRAYKKYGIDLFAKSLLDNDDDKFLCRQILNQLV